MNLEKFPDDLVINIKNGALSSNYNHPYFLWLDYENAKHLIVVIDETASINKISEYGTYILLTRNQVVYKNSAGIIKKQSLDALKYLNNQVINKSMARGIQKSIQSLTQLIIFFYPLLFVLLFLFLSVTSLFVNMLYLIVATGIVMIMFNMLLQKKPGLQFAKTYQISLHSVTLPLTLNYVLAFINVRTDPLPIWFIFLITIFTLAGVYEAFSYKPIHHHIIHHKK